MLKNIEEYRIIIVGCLGIGYEWRRKQVPKKMTFYNWKLARECAITYMNVGEELYRKACEAEANDVTKYAIPAMTNTSFACEIFMKEMLRGDEGHNLKELFEKLPKECSDWVRQAVIREICCNSDGGYGEDDFNDELELAQSTFVTCRYFYEAREGEGKHAQVGFVIVLARNLYHYLTFEKYSE